MGCWCDMQATGLGGALYASDLRLHASHVNMTNNTAQSGGAVAWQYKGNQSLVDCSMQGNRAYLGGAFAATHVELMVERCQFINNTAAVLVSGSVLESTCKLSGLTCVTQLCLPCLPTVQLHS